MWHMQPVDPESVPIAKRALYHNERCDSVCAMKSARMHANMSLYIREKIGKYISRMKAAYLFHSEMDTNLSQGNNRLQ